MKNLSFVCAALAVLAIVTIALVWGRSGSSDEKAIVGVERGRPASGDEKVIAGVEWYEDDHAGVIARPVMFKPGRDGHDNVFISYGTYVPLNELLNQPQTLIAGKPAARPGVKSQVTPLGALAADAEQGKSAMISFAPDGDGSYALIGFSVDLSWKISAKVNLPQGDAVLIDASPHKLFEHCLIGGSISFEYKF